VITGAALVAAAATVSISPSGADSHTFDRAYHAARPNTLVYVKAGVYPPQTISGRGHPVIFVGQGSVRIGQSELNNASNIEFRQMRIDGWTLNASNHVTFRKVNTVGAFYLNAPSSWVSVIGGAVGSSRNANSYIAVPDDSVTQPSRHLLFDGVRFHDVTRDPDEHVECLMLAQGIDVTIRNSVFTRCSVFDIFITWWEFRPAVPPPARVRIQDNRFDHTTDGYFSLHWTSVVAAGNRTWDTFAITGNTCGQDADFGSAAPRKNFVIRSNPGC
jgi:hypothetical protein